MAESSNSSIRVQQLVVAMVQAVGLLLFVLGVIDASSTLEIIGAVIFVIGVAAGIRVIVTARRASISKSVP